MYTLYRLTYIGIKYKLKLVYIGCMCKYNEYESNL